MTAGIDLITRYVQSASLPDQAVELFGDGISIEGLCFKLQEGFLIDFKENIPTSFANGYGAGIIRLGLALFNTYGGLIVFGVLDEDFSIVGCEPEFDIEAYNRFLSDVSGKRIECLTRSYRIPGVDLPLQVILVPRRGIEQPAKLQRDLDKYKAGTLWVRDQHEVLSASTQHLALLYSRRDDYRLSVRRESGPSVHRSLPPSPATLHDFVGRNDLMQQLWRWFIFSDQPRVYLHGPGGSGKSTMAYEFAKTVADEAGVIGFPHGQPLDYVLYLSGKENELNTSTGRQQKYELSDFNDANSQYAQILCHAGMASGEEIFRLGHEDIERKLEELFNEFSGLIVIDDIDSLSRRNIDTGEENLFLQAVRSRRKTKILYTLRYVPPYALRSAIQVPGLNFEEEVPDFVAACCKQFRTPEPQVQELPQLQQRTSGLPLLIETIVGLRRDCSNYPNAFRIFDQRGGDEARRYLYQREYDKLDPNGRGKELLCALFLIDSKVTFTLLESILSSFPPDQIRDSISETSSIFLTSSENTVGETSYQLSPPCVNLVRTLSPGLSFYGAIKRSVEQFRSIESKLTPTEISTLARMKRLIRSKLHEDVINMASGIKIDDPIRVNPEFQSLLGQAFSRIGPAGFTQARECFNTAFQKRHWDIFMMRQWYYVEMHSGYSLSDAQKICEAVVASADISARHKNEFFSKLGACFIQQSRPHRFTDRSRAIDFAKKSLFAYFESAWAGRGVPDIDRNLSREWLQDSAVYFVQLIDEELEHLFSFIESLGETKHDVDMDAARTLIDPLQVLSRNPRPAVRNRLKGLCSRTISALQKSHRRIDDARGIEYTISKLEALRDASEARHGW